jgi:hypothetical protein
MKTRILVNALRRFVIGSAAALATVGILAASCKAQAQSLTYSITMSGYADANFSGITGRLTLRSRFFNNPLDVNLNATSSGRTGAVQFVSNKSFVTGQNIDVANVQVSRLADGRTLIVVQQKSTVTASTIYNPNNYMGAPNGSWLDFGYRVVDRGYIVLYLSSDGRTLTGTTNLTGKIPNNGYSYHIANFTGRLL